MYLLTNELRKHKRILSYYRDLPSCIRVKIQEYHLSKLPMLLCPGCGSGYYQIFLPVLQASARNCFMCEHNFFMLQFCNQASLAERIPPLLM